MLQLVFLNDRGSYNFLHQNHSFASRKRGILACLSNPASGLGSSCWPQRLGEELGGWHLCHVHADLIRYHPQNGLVVAAHRESLNLRRFN